MNQFIPIARASLSWLLPLSQDLVTKPTSYWTSKVAITGVFLGPKIYELVTYVVAALTLGTARHLYNIAISAARAALKKFVTDFTIVIAEPLFLDGHRETFITVSNYWTDGWGKVFEVMLKALSLYGKVTGGERQPNPSDHAETLMVARLKATPDLAWPDAIPGSVSGNVCTDCQNAATDTSIPGQRPGYVVYDIDTIKGITLVLFAPGLNRV